MSVRPEDGSDHQRPSVRPEDGSDHQRPSVRPEDGSDHQRLSVRPEDGSDHQRVSNRRLLVLAGPSGVGKGTVVAALRELLPDLWVSVSVTSRAPRAGEVDGEHYLFVDHGEYERMVTAGGLLEHDEHFGAGYGTPRGPVEAALVAGRPCLLEIDYEGARQVRAALGERALLVMLLPPSLAELERRLRSRGTEDPVALERRLERARAELAAQDEFEVTIVNADVQESARRLLDLLQPH